MTAVILPFPGRPIREAEIPSPSLGVPLPPPPIPKVPAPTARPLDRPRRTLSPQEQVLQDAMLVAYFHGHRVAKGHAPRTIQKSYRWALEFLTYVGQPIWACTPGDFEAWASHLGLERNLAHASQRTMQSEVAGLFDWLVDQIDWQNRAHQEFQGRSVRVATSSNRIVHTTDRNGSVKRARKFLTGEQVTDLFATLDRAIEIAACEVPRVLKTLQRDRALLYTYYACGLRLSEGAGMNLDHWGPNPRVPAFGDYGSVMVWGKGSRGSGPRTRVIDHVHPDLPPLLEWYVDQVRPKFKALDDDAAKALWRSERGNRLTGESIASRVKVVLGTCGYDPTLFSTHGLRHMSVSNLTVAGAPLPFVQGYHGHVIGGSTTSAYIHLPDDYINANAAALIRSSVNWEDKA